MKLIKTMIAVAFIIIASNVAMAQQQKRTQMTPDQRADKMMEHMTKKLGLTDAQKPKIRAVLLERIQKRDLAMEKIKEERKAVHTAMKAENEESDKEIVGVLDASQIEKYNKMKADKKAKMQEHKEKRGDAQPMQEPANN